MSLFDRLAYASVRKAISSGYVHCTVPCTAPMTITVRQSSCVQRIGSGSLTTFVACSGAPYCFREYAICCDGSGMTVTPVTYPQNPSCSGGYASGCEATCQ
jgi:hypothetical protein